MDVDGTMTDGTIYIGPTGEAMKAFCVKDGMGIAMLRENGIKTAIITGRTSSAVSFRAKELHVDYVYQGIKDKVLILKEICEKEKIMLEQVAYIGDDLNDIDAAKKVGFSFAPQDATAEMKHAVNMVLSFSGGKGAVRSCVEYILATKKTSEEDK